jgi:hypothetical protein
LSEEIETLVSQAMVVVKRMSGTHCSATLARRLLPLLGTRHVNICRAHLQTVVGVSSIWLSLWFGVAFWRRERAADAGELESPLFCQVVRKFGLSGKLLMLILGERKL